MLLEVVMLSVLSASPCDGDCCRRPILNVVAKVPVILRVEVVGVVAKKTRGVLRKRANVARRPMLFARKVRGRVPIVRRIRHCR